MTGFVDLEIMFENMFVDRFTKMFKVFDCWQLSRSVSRSVVSLRVGLQGIMLVKNDREFREKLRKIQTHMYKHMLMYTHAYTYICMPTCIHNFAKYATSQIQKIFITSAVVQ